MKEKDTQALVGASFKSLFKNDGLFYHKIRDDGAWQPFDAFMIVNSVPFAMEYKISKLKKGLNFAQLFKDREHQFKALDAYEKAGGHGLVIVHHYEPRNSRYFIMNWLYAKEYYDEGKQIPWSELEQHEVNSIMIDEEMPDGSTYRKRIIDFAPYMYESDQFGILAAKRFDCDWQGVEIAYDQLIDEK